MHAAQRPKSKFKFVTLGNESNMSTLWRREYFLRICNEEDLAVAEESQEIEMIIPVKKSQQTWYKHDPVSYFVNCLWGKSPDGVAINEALQIVYILPSNNSGNQDGTVRTIQDPPMSMKNKHIYYSLLIRTVFCHVSNNLSLYRLFYITMNIYSNFYFNIARDTGV